MRTYVSSDFYDYTRIIIRFLIIRKYYNPIFYDYAHILNRFWIYLQGGFYMAISRIVKFEIPRYLENLIDIVIDKFNE